MDTIKEPATLQEAILYFSSPDNCRDYLVARRWPDGVTCPRCESKSVKFQAKHNRWQCAGHHDRRQFTLKTGTIFEDSAIGLDKWLAAMWQVVNCKNGISSYEVHRTIGVTQKTAWFMDHRIRFALGMSPVDKLSPQAAHHRNGNERQDCGDGNTGARRQGSHHGRTEPEESGPAI
jgi:transposase-like protein